MTRMPEAYETKEGTKSYNEPNNPAFEVAVNGVLQALRTYDFEYVREQVSRTKFFEVFTSDKVAWHFDPAVVWAVACKRSWLGVIHLDETVPKTIVYNVDQNLIEKIMAIQKTRVADNIKYLSLVSPEEHPDGDDHPSHYIYDGVDVIQLTELTEQMNFNRGNAVKYIARAGRKDPQDELVDLEKAAWYIRREIERLWKGVNKDGGTEKT